MSADNWSICPRCYKQREADKKAKEQVLNDSYGKIPQDQYLRLKNEKIEPLKETLREDYEVGIYEGRFFVDYHGGCEKCGFTHTFNHEQIIKP